MAQARSCSPRIVHKPRPAIDAIRLSVWHRRLTYLSTGLLVATGLAWLALDFVARGRADSVGPHPLAHSVLAAHGAIAMVALGAYGGVLAAHVPRAWAVERNRWTGCLVAAVLAMLIATGWLLYYASSEEVHAFASACHWVVGLAVALVLPLHVVTGRRARRLATQASMSAPMSASASFPAD